MRFLAASLTVCGLLLCLLLTVTAPIEAETRQSPSSGVQPQGRIQFKQTTIPDREAKSASPGLTRSADTTAPALVTATVNGTSLVLTYNEELDADSPPASAFTVQMEGTSLTVSNPAISGKTVVLTISQAVAFGTSVKVSYTVPATNPVQDTNGNVALALVKKQVNNTTPGTLAKNTGQNPGNYDSAAFYATLVGSNIFFTGISAAQRFTTGEAQAGYNLSAVELALSRVGSDALPKIRLFSDSSGQPGTELHTLTNPDAIASGDFDGAVINSFTAPDGTVLKPNTSYWVLLENENTGAGADDAYYTWATDSDNEDAADATGWTIADERRSRSGTDGAWTENTYALRIAVKGSVIPLPDTSLSALEVRDGDGNEAIMGPALHYDTTGYAAFVANDTGEVTVSATASDGEATVEYLDRDGNAISDEDNGTEGLQLSIATGDTHVQARVTAPDGVRTQTYTVIVTRLNATAEALISNADQVTQSNRLGGRTGQGFRTGAHGNGYLFTGVELNLHPLSDDVWVRLAPKSPGSEVADLSDPAKVITLTNPESPTAGWNEYKAPPGTILPKNRNYVVLITDADGTGDPGGLTITTVNSDEDPGGVPGWSISNFMTNRDEGDDSWTTFQTPAKITVKGHTLASRNTKLTDVRVTDPDGNPLTLRPKVGSVDNAASTYYRLTVGNQVDEITVIPVTSHPNTTFIYRTPFHHGIDDSDPRREGHQIGLPVGEMDIEIFTTAENRYSNEEYKLVVTRRSLSTDATLSSLELTYDQDGSDAPLTLTPAFDAAVTGYSANVPYSVDQITIAATEKDPDASAAYLQSDADTVKEGHQVALQPGQNTVSVKVTAERVQNTRTYSVVVTRVPASTDATLSDLQLTHDDGGTETSASLTPAFSASTQSYTASVSNSVAQITVAPTKNDGNATVTYLDAQYNALADADTGTGGQQVALNVGHNTIRVRVTAEDETTTRDYTLAVARRIAADIVVNPDSLTITEDGIGVFTVRLTIQPGADVNVSATSSDTGAATLSNHSLTFTPETWSASQVVTVHGVGDTDANDETVTVTVTASSTDSEYSGSTQSVRVSVSDTTSTDASLSNLVLEDEDGNPVTLDPIFNASSYSYAASVGHGIDQVTVTPTRNHDDATFAYLDAGDNAIEDANGNEEGHQVGLVAGQNIVKVRVTAEDGQTTRTYTVTVNRAEEPAPEDEPSPEPAEEPSQEPSLADACEKDDRDGVIADCVVTGFAVVRVEHDGTVNIDWSEWDQENPQVTGYTIHLSQLLYRAYYDEDGEVSDEDLDGVYGSCEFKDGSWQCQGPLTSNYFEDWDGNPTQVLQLASNEDRTSWSHALDRPGRHDSKLDFVRWSGDATDPDNEPVDISYDVTEFEIDMYYFSIHEGNRHAGRKIVAVNGSTGFD